MIVLETERLALREFIDADAPFILTLLNEPSFLQFIGDRGVRTLDDARAYIASRMLASYAANGFGLWMVERRDDGAQTGMCGLIRRDTLDDVDIGFAFLPAYWRCGYAVEAAAACLAQAFGPLGMTRVVAITNLDNDRSIRVLERIGLSFERTLRLPGEDEDVRLYGVNRGTP